MLGSLLLLMLGLCSTLVSLLYNLLRFLDHETTENADEPDAVNTYFEIMSFTFGAHLSHLSVNYWNFELGSLVSLFQSALFHRDLMIRWRRFRNATHSIQREINSVNAHRRSRRQSAPRRQLPGHANRRVHGQPTPRHKRDRQADVRVILQTHQRLLQQRPTLHPERGPKF